jgi:drug/metabolite transporter (DMT)-like permease
MIFILFIIAVAALIAAAWYYWPRIGQWFSDSETLFWARLQMAAGAVLTVLTTTDLTPVLTATGLGKWAPLWLVASGVITELARRSRATDV